MSPLEHAISRLVAFLDEVQRLSECEFPSEHSQIGLEHLRIAFDAKLNRLCSFDSRSDPAIVRQECKLALNSLFQYVPLLGFFLRSTNVRNAFEVVGPLLRLARAVLEYDVPKDQRKTRLILSSEWAYSPFVYRDIPDLPGFVLIGLPAPESSNPLLIPLAGHELGHSVWARRQLVLHFRPIITSNVLRRIQVRWAEFCTVFPAPSAKPLSPADLSNNMFCVDFWQQVVAWALRQAEESFCDFVGLRLFGESYVSAFAYLLSPGSPSPRPILYPSVLTRIQNLYKAAAEFQIPLAAQFTSLFDAEPDPPLAPGDRFRLSLADEAVSDVIDQLIKRAGTEIANAGIDLPSSTECQRILARFRAVVPAERCHGLSEILNAAWLAYEDPSLWSTIPQVSRSRDRNLRELVLKNIEVFEIEQILGDQP